MASKKKNIYIYTYSIAFLGQSMQNARSRLAIISALQWKSESLIRRNCNFRAVARTTRHTRRAFKPHCAPRTAHSNKRNPLILAATATGKEKKKEKEKKKVHSKGPQLLGEGESFCDQTNSSVVIHHRLRSFLPLSLFSMQIPLSPRMQINRICTRELLNVGSHVS